jgi:cell wall-associated NlpC family hydrolase
VRIVATTLTNLHKEPSFHTELLTQVTNGVELQMLKTEGEWCHVRQSDGYEGWAYASYLTEPPASFRPTHVVSEPSVTLLESPRLHGAPVTRVPIGTAVRVSEQQAVWARVDLVGGAANGGWALADLLRPLASLPLPPAKARQQIVADARRMTGVYYVWGGTTACGIDCSGLAQLCYKLSGHTLPRDARLQFPVGHAVEGQPRPGDLLFFCGETNRDRITHVGISLGGRTMIHSSRSRNGVYEDDLDASKNESMRNRFVGARSFLD